MRIDTPQRMARPIPLTPLIDVVFLLLMFFMLSTTFAKFGMFGLGGGPAAKEDTAGNPGAAAPPDIWIDVSAGPAVRVNGSNVALADLPERLDSLHGLGLSSAVLRVRSSATVQDLLSVLEASRSSSLSSIALSR